MTQKIPGILRKTFTGLERRKNLRVVLIVSINCCGTQLLLVTLIALDLVIKISIISPG